MEMCPSRLILEEECKRNRAVNSSKDLLRLERKTTPLERRLLLCTSTASHCNSDIDLKSKKPPTTELVPESCVLGRIKSFLPTLSEANQKLFSDIEEKGAYEFNIEAVTEEDEQYIEMDLALGVADLRSQEAVAAAEFVVNGQVHDVKQGSNSLDCSCGTHNDSFGEESCSEEEIDELYSVRKSVGSSPEDSDLIIFLPSDRSGSKRNLDFF